MKKLFFLFIILFNTIFVFSEEFPAEEPIEETETNDRTSMIGISLGYTIAGFREVTIADVNRYLNAMVFSIHSTVDKDPFLHAFNMDFFSGRNELLAKYPVYQFENEYDDYYNVQDTYTKLALEYAIAGKLWEPMEAFPGYLGGAIHGDLNLIQTLENPLYINFTAIVSLNLYAVQKWIINDKNQLVLSLSIPVFGYALRPNYIGMSAWPLETGIASVHNYWACFGSLKYFYKINKFISIYSDIGFGTAHINFPRTRKDAFFQIKLGAVYTY